MSRVRASNRGSIICFDRKSRFVSHPWGMIEHMFDYERRIEAGITPSPLEVEQHEMLHGEYPRAAWQRHRARIADFDRLVAAENRQRLELLDEVAAADRDGFWHDDAAPSMADWLTYRYKMSKYAAHRITKVASAIQTMPTVREAFASAVLSWDQLQAIAAIADEVDHPDPDAYLAAEAVGKTPQEIRDLVANRTPVDPNPSSPEGMTARWVRYRFSDSESTMEMRVRLPDAEGAALVTALARRAYQRDVDPVTGVFLPQETAMADALIEIASQTLADDSDHDRATILVSTTVETLLGTSEEPARVVDGPNISNPTLRRLACDARLQLVIEDPQSGTVGVGRTTRSIPPWLARIIRSRDGGCRFPECDRTRWVQIHHLVHWADGGPTDVDNLITLCGFHHRLVHLSGWRISGNPETEITWIAPWGEPYHRLRVRIPGVESARDIRKHLSVKFLPPEHRRT